MSWGETMEETPREQLVSSEVIKGAKSPDFSSFLMLSDESAQHMEPSTEAPLNGQKQIDPMKLTKAHKSSLKTDKIKAKAQKIEKARQLLKLSIRQRNAIDMIVIGASDMEVAEKIEIARETVTRWRLYHPAFRAELNRSRQAVWGGSADQLRTLLRHSLSLLEEVLSDPGHPKRAEIALGLVRDSGLFVLLGNIGGSKLSEALNEVDDAVKFEQYIDPEDVVSRDSYYFDKLNELVNWFEGDDPQ